MKKDLDSLNYTCYNNKELETLMTNIEGVNLEVIHEIKRMVKPGTPITKRMWKFAYQNVRARAIVETAKWKQKWITIE